jgi:acyl carrier protein
VECNSPYSQMTAISEEEFLKQFREIVAEDSVDTLTRLEAVAGWDSIAYLSVTIMIEETMGVTISPDALVDAGTVRDLYSAACAAQV